MHPHPYPPPLWGEPGTTESPRDPSARGGTARSARCTGTSCCRRSCSTPSRAQAGKTRGQRATTTTEWTSLQGRRGGEGGWRWRWRGELRCAGAHTSVALHDASEGHGVVTRSVRVGDALEREPARGGEEVPATAAAHAADRLVVGDGPGQVRREEVRVRRRGHVVQVELPLERATRHADGGVVVCRRQLGRRVDDIVNGELHVTAGGGRAPFRAASHPIHLLRQSIEHPPLPRTQKHVADKDVLENDRLAGRRARSVQGRGSKRWRKGGQDSPPKPVRRHGSSTRRRPDRHTNGGPRCTPAPDWNRGVALKGHMRSKRIADRKGSSVSKGERGNRDQGRESEHFRTIIRRPKCSSVTRTESNRTTRLRLTPTSSRSVHTALKEEFNEPSPQTPREPR